MKKPDKNSRREFLRKVIATSAIAGMIPYINPVELLAAQGSKGVLPKRPLGKTGYKVGIFSLGGQATNETPGKET